jgi:hypothetical protein
MIPSSDALNVLERLNVHLHGFFSFPLLSVLVVLPFRFIALAAPATA